MRYRGLALGIVLLGLFGCSRDEIRVYQVAKATPPMLHLAAAPAELNWVVPGGWKTLPATGPRLATFEVRDCQVAITAFPGDAGGILANVNRWRGQIQLPAIVASALSHGVTQKTLGQFTYQLVQIQNPSQHQGMMVGVLDYHQQTWFIKLSGPLDELTATRAQFLRFLESVTPREGR